MAVEAAVDALVEDVGDESVDDVVEKAAAEAVEEAVEASGAALPAAPTAAWTGRVAPPGQWVVSAPWQALYLRPLPHGQGSLRPTFCGSRRIGSFGARLRSRCSRK